MAYDLIEPQFFESFDGTRLAWRETGGGRPVVLIHGYFSDAMTNWVRYGHAAAIAAQGFLVIMPDLRAHGDSAKPHEAAAYPPDALGLDVMALIEHLGLTEYDLGGYSLGGRTTVRMIAALGARPRRVVISGMGYQGLVDTGARAAHFRTILNGLGSFERGTPEWMAEAFLKTTGGDSDALLRILDTFVDTPADKLGEITQPTLVLAGSEDSDNGSGQQLADLLTDAWFETVPGGHMSAVVQPELGRRIAAFLSA